MFEEMHNMLTRLGLKEREVTAYLACLAAKQGLFVSEITKQTGLKRSSVNLILERLTKRGFVTYHLDGARKRFVAEQPEVLLFRFEDSLSDFRALIPLLHASTSGDKSTKVRFFEGKEGVEKIFADILLTMRVSRDKKKEILAVSSGKDIFSFLPGHKKNFIDKRVKAKIPTRWIAPDSPVSRGLSEIASSEYRKMKFFDPNKYKFTIEIDIYVDSIALISFTDELSGVIIENKALADSFRGLFNLLWDSLKT